MVGQRVELLPHPRGRVARQHSLQLALVSMPFASTHRPSIQLGILKAVSLRAGFHAASFHLNLDLASMIGLEKYELISVCARASIGDWLFSPAAFGEQAPDIDAAHFRPSGAATTIMQEGLGARWREALLDIRNRVIPAYIDSIVTRVPWEDYPIVGFSSTFQQNVASLALARRLKEARPTIVIVGGSNVEGPMGEEFVRAFDSVDCVVNGEAEIVLPALLEAIEAGRDLESVPGVATRDKPHSERQVVEDMNLSPLPMYEEFFARAEELKLSQVMTPGFVELPFETARGCWWGERRHCIFCGLNGTGMGFRSKGPDRAASDISQLRSRYRRFNLSAVDNILDKNYVGAVFGSTNLGDGDLSIFYEVKADLGREDIESLVNAGVDRVQPGIESLSSHVLALMRKGTRASWNITFLKWARFYGMYLNWNLLYGFPGETSKDYEDQAQLMGFLHHLQPPSMVGRIEMDRFSPLFEDRDTFPAHRINPVPMYEQIYPHQCQLDKLAYYFEGELDAELPTHAYRFVYDAAHLWDAAWRRPMPPTLTYRWMPGYATVQDRRSSGPPSEKVLEGNAADAFEYCSSRPRKWDEVRARFRGVEDQVSELLRSGLMVRDGNLLLSIALPGHPRARHRPERLAEDEIDAAKSEALEH